MFRQSIANRLKELDISAHKCAKDNDLVYQNFNSWLTGNRKTFPLPDLEKVCRYLKLKLKS